MEVDELASIAQKGFKELEERLGGRIDGLGGRIDGLGGRIDGLEERVITLDGRVVEISHTQSDHGGRLRNLDARLDTLYGRVASVDDRVHQTKILVEQLRDDVKQVSEGVEMHHQQLRRNIEETDRRFDDIQSVFRNYRAAGRKRTTARAKPSR